MIEDCDCGYCLACRLRAEDEYDRQSKFLIVCALVIAVSSLVYVFWG